VTGKKSLKTDAEVRSAVDALLGQFGVVGEAEGDFGDEAPPVVKTGERVGSAPSAKVDALWGGGGKQK
jgi:hypothetical protein